MAHELADKHIAASKVLIPWQRLIVIHALNLAPFCFIALPINVY